MVVDAEKGGVDAVCVGVLMSSTLSESDEESDNVVALRFGLDIRELISVSQTLLAIDSMDCLRRLGVGGVSEGSDKDDFRFSCSFFKEE